MYQRADVKVGILTDVRTHRPTGLPRKVSLEDGYEAGNVSPVKVAFKVLKEIERIIDEKVNKILPSVNLTLPLTG